MCGCRELWSRLGIFIFQLEDRGFWIGIYLLELEFFEAPEASVVRFQGRRLKIILPETRAKCIEQKTAF